MIDLIPRWPPSPPWARIRIVPKAKSRSSWMTTRALGGTWNSSINRTSASPLRFIKVCGFASTTSQPSHRPFAQWESMPFLVTGIDQLRASRSMTRKPMLWRVNWYSRPGLPRPTISHTKLREIALVIRILPLLPSFLLQPPQPPRQAPPLLLPWRPPRSPPCGRRE